MDTAVDFLSEAERRQVQEAIGEAEKLTSGELRVHLEDRIEDDVLDHAAFVFNELGMHRTEERNGVLIYICVADRRIAVIGDAGINSKVPEGFWQDVVSVLQLHFAAGRRAEGLCEAAHMIGAKLSLYFPVKANDTNELSNDISFGK